MGVAGPNLKFVRSGRVWGVGVGVERLGGGEGVIRKEGVVSDWKAGLVEQKELRF